MFSLCEWEKKQNDWSHPAARGTKDLDKLAQWVWLARHHDQTAKQNSTPSGCEVDFHTTCSTFYLCITFHFCLRDLVAFVCQFLSRTWKRPAQWTRWLLKPFDTLNLSTKTKLNSLHESLTSSITRYIITSSWWSFPTSATVDMLLTVFSRYPKTIGKDFTNFQSLLNANGKRHAGEGRRKVRQGRWSNGECRSLDVTIPGVPLASKP